MQIEQYISQIKEKIEKELERIVEENCDDILKEAISYCLLDGGKRLRGILATEGCRIGGGDFKDGILLAAAIEFIHCYTLIHDDLPALDNQNYRRGKLSLHKKFNEAVAILVGDALLTLGFHTLSQLNSENALKIIKKLSYTIGPKVLIKGQIEDLFPKNKDKKTLDFIYANKTAAFIKDSLLLGFELGSRNDQNTKEKLEKFGDIFGYAFQLHDDIEDVIFDSGKISYVNLYGLEESQRTLEELKKQAKVILKDLQDSEILNYIVDKFW